MGKVMDDNMKKNQEFMLSSQAMQMERQLTMQMEMRNRMMAQQLAMVREAFNWYGSFYVLATLGLVAGYVRTKNPGLIAPIIPLSFIVGYQGDMALGNKMERILSDADKILENEPQLLRIPGEKLSVDLVDRKRKS
jgi:hypothetical protein